MADIFISYAREDRNRIEPLAHALEEQGWSVWWDIQLGSGERIEERILEELAVARCVVVAWSRTSVKKPFVKDEARIGQSRNVLFPIFLDRVNVPLGFGDIHAVNLSDWYSKKDRTGLQKLLNDIHQFIVPGSKEIDDNGKLEIEHGILLKLKLYLAKIQPYKRALLCSLMSAPVGAVVLWLSLQASKLVYFFLIIIFRPKSTTDFPSHWTFMVVIIVVIYVEIAISYLFWKPSGCKSFV